VVIALELRVTTLPTIEMIEIVDEKQFTPYALEVTSLEPTSRA